MDAGLFPTLVGGLAANKGIRMGLSSKIGKHFVEISDDILFMKLVGDQSGEEAQTLMHQLAENFADAPYYAILDYSEMGQIEPAARKAFGEMTTDRKFLGAAIFGANLTTRTLTILVQSAIRLVGKKAIPLAFVKNMDEARSWIAEQKAKAAQPPR